jgi:hypothetical protein
VTCVHGPASGKDIQEVSPVPLKNPLIIVFLQYCVGSLSLSTFFHDAADIISFCTHRTLITHRQSSRIGKGGCKAFHRLWYTFGHLPAFGPLGRRQRIEDPSHMAAFYVQDLVK